MKILVGAPKGVKNLSIQYYIVTCSLWLVVYMQRKDLLQLMIDAADGDTAEKLETGEIIADSVGFILAGYETTSTAITFATYLLATHPEVQERLANKIHEYFEENPVSNLNSSVSCAVIHSNPNPLCSKLNEHM